MFAILTNLRTIGITMVIIACFLSGMWVEKQIGKERLKSALQEQEAALVAKCEADKEYTKKIGKEYEAKISTLSNRVASLKRMSATKCVSISGSAGKPDGSAATGLPDVDGIPASELIDLAAAAEKQRNQLISLQDFVRGLQ